MRISDWSSDVCSSDLVEAPPQPNVGESQKPDGPLAAEGAKAGEVESLVEVAPEIEVGEHKKVASTRGAIQKSRSTDRAMFEIGRASCRERVCQYVSISVVAVTLKKKYQI